MAQMPKDPKVLAYHAASVRRVNAEKRRYIHAYKTDKGCQICGEKELVCLDLHHNEEINPRIKPKKGQMRRDIVRLSWDDIVEELSKCTVLCANCHRKIHKVRGPQGSVENLE